MNADDLTERIEDLTKRVDEGPWSDRIKAVRSVPNEFAGKDHADVYAKVAKTFYVPKLGPHFHIVPWPETYADRPAFFEAYEAAKQGTKGFAQTDPKSIAAVIKASPRSLRIFRLIMGYTTRELADTSALSQTAISRLEKGGEVADRLKPDIEKLAKIISDVVGGKGPYSVSNDLKEKGFKGKGDKPDTADGWDTVRRFAAKGVPYSELLYQRFYGGAFRQVQDAGGSRKGDILEDATEEIFKKHGVPYVRTVRGTESKAGKRFGIQVRPAPDFILHDGKSVKGLLECKSAGDGGTARDKASRYATLREEAKRLGGIPVLAVLEGLGWRRVRDALGPVVRDCDGRVFTMKNLDEILEVDPVNDLLGRAAELKADVSEEQVEQKAAEES